MTGNVAAPASPGELVLETERLSVRRLVQDDAAFVLELLNDPAFLANIGDRGVRTLADARAYLERGPIASYRRHGFGLWRVELRASGEPIGICGVLRREGLADPDLGFALLPDHRSRGYALEAAQAVLDHARARLGLGRLLAIVLPSNSGSKRVLERVGFRHVGQTRLTGDPTDLDLYECS